MKVATAVGIAVLAISSATGAMAQTRGAAFPDGWLDSFTENGRIDAALWESNDKTTYVCPTVAAAQAVVTAIPKKESVNAQLMAKRTAITAHHCVVTKTGKFRPTRVYEADQRLIADPKSGEPLEAWVAVAATDAKGKPVGLVFNDSDF